MKTYFHVRTATAVTIDWLESREVAMALAEKECLQVYQIDGSRAVRIR